MLVCQNNVANKTTQTFQQRLVLVNNEGTEVDGKGTAVDDTSRAVDDKGIGVNDKGTNKQTALFGPITKKEPKDIFRRALKPCSYSPTRTMCPSYSNI